MSHATNFAGIQGSAAFAVMSAEDVHAANRVAIIESGSLFDPEGRWAIRLRAIAPEQARILLQVLRDLTSTAQQTDNSLVRRVSAYDESAGLSLVLRSEIEQGLQALDSLARRVAKNPYLSVPERSLRRVLLSQLANEPLFAQLGVHMPTRSAAAV